MRTKSRKDRLQENPAELKYYTKEKNILKDAKLCCRAAEMTIYGRTYPYTEYYYVDIPSGDEFLTDDVNRINEEQYYAAYRIDRGLPFPCEIKAFREKLGLDQQQMALLLRFDPYDYEYEPVEEGEELMPMEKMLWLAEAMKNPNLLYPFENNKYFWTLGFNVFFPKAKLKVFEHRMKELIEEYNNHK